MQWRMAGEGSWGREARRERLAAGRWIEAKESEKENEKAAGGACMRLRGRGGREPSRPGSRAWGVARSDELRSDE